MLRITVDADAWRIAFKPVRIFETDSSLQADIDPRKRPESIEDVRLTRRRNRLSRNHATKHNPPWRGT